MVPQRTKDAAANLQMSCNFLFLVAEKMDDLVFRIIFSKQFAE